VLVSWSTIGLEFARMGAPVLASTVDPNVSPFPSDDFVEWAETKEGYFRKLDELLGRPATIEIVLHAFRWFNLYFLGNTLHLGDIIAERQALTLPPFRRSREASAIEDIIIGRRDILDIQHERVRGAQSSKQTAAEREELSRGLRRILHFLLTGVDDPKDRPLTVLRPEASGMSSPPSPAAGRVLVANGRQVEYWSEGRCYKRFSPLAARLAPLCGESVRTGVGDAAQKDA